MIKNFSFLTLWVFGFLISVCSSKEEEAFTDYLSPQNNSSSHHFKDYRLEFDSLPKVEIPHSHRFQRMNNDRLIKDSELLFESDKIIIKSDLKTHQSITFQPNDYEIKSSLLDFIPISESQIAILQHMPPALFIGKEADFKYIKLKKVNFTYNNAQLSQRLKSLLPSEFNFNLSVLRPMQYDEDKNQLHIGLYPPDYFILENMQYTETIGVFDLNTEGWSHFYGSARGANRYRGEYSYGTMMGLGYFHLINSDSTILSYPTSHQLFLVNPASDSLINTFEASSQHAVKIEPAMKGKEIPSEFARLQD
ncbi:MAG: hypothetical protein LAT68_12325 [Cyclobacteriaceae bacterium]|nr:hypothetical protein [Cyclobacteriaceae bacterium]MCH8517104.1 hypothetical protein [Cyclobacteriaceae bacterium]